MTGYTKNAKVNLDGCDLFSTWCLPIYIALNYCLVINQYFFSYAINTFFENSVSDDVNWHKVWIKAVVK